MHFQLHIQERHSKSLSILIDRDQITLALELFLDVRLLTEHKPLDLGSLLSQPFKPLKDLFISLVTSGLLGILPMALGESNQSSDFFVFDVVDERADRPRFFEPVALPEFARADALVSAGLEVDAAGHGTAMDGVY